uniref:Glutaredoxin domain-containing protein n=1 Tax=Macrostomum lignano TaxID=282301 RepID=A0A1I8JPC7_9PLAT
LSYQPAPKPEAYTFDPDAGIKTFEQLPKVTEEILRNILLQYASENCCQSSQFIRDLPIIKIETTLAWHYCLETYLEARYTCWTFEPFDNQEVDGRENGRPPAPWEVELKPDRPFKDEDKETVVPHTCRLKPCHHCSQAGCLACQRCKGRRYLRCGECSGPGQEDSTAGHRGEEGGLLWLRWPGEKERLLFYVKLKCEWRRRDADFIEEKTDLPDELVRDVSGKLIFLEEDEFVSPIQNFPYASVNEASAKLLQEAERSYRGQ